MRETLYKTTIVSTVSASLPRGWWENYTTNCSTSHFAEAPNHVLQSNVSLHEKVSFLNSIRAY